MTKDEDINELKLKIDELTEAVKILSEKQNSQYTDMMMELKGIKLFVDNVRDIDVDSRTEDEFYDEAKKIVIKFGKASTSYLQRKLGIGYARAAQLIDKLEEEDVIGPNNGSTPREVLIKPEEE